MICFTNTLFKEVTFWDGLMVSHIQNKLNFQDWISWLDARFFMGVYGLVRAMMSEGKC